MSNPYTELKNIKYKNMLLSSKETNKNNSQTAINDFLDKERAFNKKEPWNRLDKTIKIKKLQDFSVRYSNDNKLTSSQSKNLMQYLRNCLDRKRFERVKDINYDTKNQVIKSIPNLILNKTTKKFTLKRNEKRVSTLKSLAPKKKSTNKTKKINISD